MPFADAATGYRLAAKRKGALRAAQRLGLKTAENGSWWHAASSAATKGISQIGKAGRVASKALGSLPTGVGNAASAALGAVTEGVSNTMSARPGAINKAKAALAGGASGLANAIPGIGWVMNATPSMNRALGVKVASRFDPEAFQRFIGGLRAGDVINFNTRTPDALSTSFRKGLSSRLISDPIRMVTGSPEHHTAVFTGMERGIPHITHNFEQGSARGLKTMPLHDFADISHFSAYRPQQTLMSEGLTAADYAKRLALSPTTRYSRRNLLLGGAVNSPLARVPGVRRTSSLLAESCDPSVGICSDLPTRAWGRARDPQSAMEWFSGRKGLSPAEASIMVTPKSISTSPFLDRVGTYAPRDTARGFSGGLLQRLSRMARL